MKLFPTLPIAPLFALLVVGAVGLGGCTAPEKDVVPPVDVPAAFSASGRAVLPDQWWRSFDDPALNRLEERALAGNLDLRTAWDRLAQARATARREGAGLWPSVGVSGSQARTRRVDVQQVPVGGDSGADAGGTPRSVERSVVSYQSDLSLDLGVSYEVDLWGRIRSQRDAARFDTRASAEEVQAAAMSLTASVAITWYRLSEQLRQIELLENQRRLNEQTLELVNTRFSKGQVGAADVLQQRQLVEASRGDVAVAEGQAGVLRNQLAILLGQPPQQVSLEKGSRISSLPPLPATGLPAELIARRPDIRQAYYFVLSADRRLWSAKADRLPAISLSGNLGTSGGRTSDLFNNWLATLGSNLMAPIIDGGARAAEVERTRAVLSERINRYGQTILVAFREVEDALIQERKQRELIVSFARQLELSRLALERTRSAYLQGQSDYIRVLSAISTLQSLERNDLAARRELVERRIDLCRALGGGWEMRSPPLAPLLTRK